MKILHVCETIKGGVATYLNTFDRECSEAVESVYLVPQHHADQLDVKGKVETFASNGRSIMASIALFRKAVRVARGERPDVLFFHSTFALIAMAWLRLNRVPGRYVYCPHCWGQVPYAEKPIARRVVAAIEGRLAGLSDLVVNISHNDRAIAEANDYGGRHIVIENALPDLPTAQAGDFPSPFGPEDDGRLNLLFVGRFDRQKGLDLLLETFSEAVARNPLLHLHVVGTSVTNGRAVSRSTAPPQTHFHEWVAPHRIAAYYHYADLVVMPSRWEGLPMVLIESLRAGTPVMLSDRSGLGKLIEQGASGFEVPLTAHDFGAALASITPECLAAMRPACRELYEKRYHSSRFRKETLAALNDLTRKPGK